MRRSDGRRRAALQAGAGGDGPGAGALALMIGAGAADRRGAGLHGQRLALAVASRPVPAALRCTVLGIVSAAGSVGAMIAAPIGQVLAEGWGWRVGRAGASWCWRWRWSRRPGSPAASMRCRLPPLAGEATMPAPRWAWRCATRMFVVMAVAYFVCGMQLVFLTTHLPSYLDLCGRTRCSRRKALGMIGALQRAGRRCSSAGPAGAGTSWCCWAASTWCARWCWACTSPGACPRLEHAGLRRHHGLPVAGRGAAGHRLVAEYLRPALAGDDPGRRLHVGHQLGASSVPSAAACCSTWPATTCWPGSSAWRWGWRRAGAGRLRLVAW